MGEGQDTGLFSVRRRIARWKLFSGGMHLCTVVGLVATVLWLVPRWEGKSVAELGREVRELEGQRQLLMEAMDKMARYQTYFAEVHGRFTRDIDRLTLPPGLASGTLEELKRSYEISVLEVHPGRFLLLATGTHNSDRMTIDEGHRINANFVLPAPSRAYLEEEADRLLHLRALGREIGEGLFARYWRLVQDEGREWVAVGQRKPVQGERRMVARPEEVGPSLFASVKERVRSRLRGESPQGRETASVKAQAAADAGDLSAQEVNEWLAAAHLAQHIHRRETGRFARRWDELDTVSDFGFVAKMRRAKNVRVRPIEWKGQDYRLLIEGTSGDLLGEQFVLDRSGSVRQVRYTEALIPQLQETTDLLENFQINPLQDDSPQNYTP